MKEGGYLRLVAAGEPYRLLFPLGAVLGAVGVLLWPLFVYGQLSFYPGLIHARIMIQGFVFCFVAGFLGTAMPHLLEVKGMSLGETLALGLTVVAVTVVRLLGYHVAADVLFSAALMLFLVFALRRWTDRQNLPPPGFVLPVLGLLCGITGSFILVCSVKFTLEQRWPHFGSLLLNHGLILLPVMGAAPYLLPRMFGLENRHLVVPKSPTPSVAWRIKAAASLTCGILLISGFYIEASGATGPGLWLRAAGIWAGLLHALPLHQIQKLRGSISWALLVSMVSILVGAVVIAIRPQSMMTWLHLIFISGIGLLILNIAARVMLGHAGKVQEIFAYSKSSWWITGLVLLAVLTRISADLLPRMQLSHYAYAGVTWAAVTILWFVVYGYLLAVPAVDESA